MQLNHFDEKERMKRLRIASALSPRNARSHQSFYPVRGTNHVMKRRRSSSGYSRTRHRKLPENSTKIVSEDESRKINIRVQLSCVAREFFFPYVSLLFGGTNDYWEPEVRCTLGPLPTIQKGVHTGP